MQDLPLSRQLLLVSTFFGLVAINLALFVDNIHTWQSAQVNPLSRLSSDSLPTFPEFAMEVIPTDTTLPAMPASAVDCHTMPYYRNSNGTVIPLGPKTPCAVRQYTNRPLVGITFPGITWSSGLTPGSPAAQGLFITIDWEQMINPLNGGTKSCVWLAMLPPSLMDQWFQGLAGSIIPACPNNQSIIPSPSAQKLVYLNGSASYRFAFNPILLTTSQALFPTTFQLLSTNLQFDVTVNTLVIGYRWTDVAAATAGFLSMSVSIWVFLFPAVPQVKHRRLFVGDRVRCDTSKNWCCCRRDHRSSCGCATTESGACCLSMIGDGSSREEQSQAAAEHEQSETEERIRSGSLLVNSSSGHAAPLLAAARLESINAAATVVATVPPAGGDSKSQ